MAERLGLAPSGGVGERAGGSSGRRVGGRAHASRGGYETLQNGSDLRGVASESDAGEQMTLTPHRMYCIGSAFAEWLNQQLGEGPTAGNSTRVSIGKDPRLSGDSLLVALAQGLASRGVNCSDIGLASTPACFMSLALKPGSNTTPFDGSVMITASHLPWNRNGAKFFTKTGGLDKKNVTDILRRAEELDDSDPLNPALIDPPPYVDFMDTYCRHLRQLIVDGINHPRIRTQPLSGFKICVDAGNGNGGFFARNVLALLGADVSGSVLLDPDGTFPMHSPNPEDSDAVEYASNATTLAGADLGIVFDTDVDRSCLIARDGTVINRNLLIALLSAVVLRENPGATIVTDSVTSSGLSDFIASLGGTHLRYKRGYKNVINKGQELNENGTNVPLMIETSGHGAMRENYYLDDGAYLAVKLVIEAVRRRVNGEGELEELLNGLRQPAEAKEARMKVLSNDFTSAGSDVIEEFREKASNDWGWRVAEENFEGYRFNIDVGGQKTGWVLLRASLHDPLLVLNAESEAYGSMDTITKPIKQWLESEKADVVDASPLAS